MKKRQQETRNSRVGGAHSSGVAEDGGSTVAGVILLPRRTPGTFFPLPTFRLDHKLGAGCTPLSPTLTMSMDEGTEVIGPPSAAEGGGGRNEDGRFPSTLTPCPSGVAPNKEDKKKRPPPIVIDWGRK